jgi:hypothetical protein
MLRSLSMRAAANIRTSPRTERLTFSAVVLLYLALSLLLFNQIEEDAFIYFRLLQNLVHGDGLVFNRGGEVLEVGSSPLWMGLLLLFWKAPWDIVITAKLLGLAAGCVSLWLILCIARVQFADRMLRFGPPLLTVGSTPFLMWSQRGLETPLVVLLVLWLALCCTDASKFRWWPLPAVLLLLARPEGFLFSLGLVPVLGFDRARWRAVWRSILLVAVAAMGVLTLRFLYFHDLVPWPFYIKMHIRGRWGVGQIVQYVSHSTLLVLGIPFALVAWKRSFWTHQRVVLGGFIMITVGWCALAKDYMPYVRHLVPAIPLGYVLLVAAADTLASAAGRSRRGLILGYIAVVFVGTLFFSRSSRDFGEFGENTVRVYLRAFARSPATFVRAIAGKLHAPAQFTPLDAIAGTTDPMSNYQSRVGDFLRRNYPANSLVVYDQMGQTPFYAGPAMRFIDSLGLTDRTIGRFYFERWHRSDPPLRIYDALASQVVRLAFGEQRDEVSEKKALDHLFGLNPDLILTNDFSVQVDPGGIPARLTQDPRLAAGYERRYTLAGGVQVYERKGAARKERLDVPPGLSVVAR